MPQPLDGLRVLYDSLVSGAEGFRKIFTVAVSAVPKENQFSRHG